MTFRVSKYAFNSWKSVANDKNASFILKHRREFKLVTFIIVLLGIFNIRGGVTLHKNIVKQNNLIQKQFEKRKNNQLAFDYMVFSQSKREGEKQINQLSLI